MAPIKKTAEQLAIPSLEEVDPTYKDMTTRLSALNASVAELGREIAETEAAIAAEARQEGPRLRAAVAELTGDVDVAAVERRKKLRELRQDVDDHQEAIGVLQRRVYDRRGIASRAVIEAIRPEVATRVGAVVAAVESAITSRKSLDELMRALEREGVETDALISAVTPFFMGDPADGHAARYVRAQKEAGYAK